MAEKIATMIAAMSTWSANTSQKFQFCALPTAAPMAAATMPTSIVRKQPRGWLFGTTIRATAPMMSPIKIAEKKPLNCMGDILAYRRTVVGKGSQKDPRAVVDAVAFGPSDVLADRDPRDTSTAPGGRDEAEAATALLVPELTSMQERLYAEGVGGGQRSLLLLLQGMDTSGKDGTVRRVVGAMNPAGVRITSFKKPTAEELAHDFLWRVDNALPEPGTVGVFNRSHYEDVLVVRVHDLVPESEWSTRYDRINEFEHRVVDAGTHIVKVMLHISKDEQKKRLGDRLADPSKYWKYNAGDLTERAFWDDYQAAYQDALARCSTDSAPWYVVPADHKWYRDWVVANLLVCAMRDLNPVYPPADFDVAEQRRLVAALD